MPNYTKLNLLELDDTVAGRVPEIQGRFGRTKLETRDVGVSHWRYAPGFRAPGGHRHREQEEVYVVVSGSGRAKLDGELIELAAWDVLRVAPAVIRAFEADPDGLEVVCIGGRRPEGGDSERFEDFWPADPSAP